ncbi:MAG: hypothetical protein ABIK61_02890 [candidate division WOR-3 bacterium]
MDTHLLRKVSTEFNRYRFPECKAKTLLNKRDILKVKFSGTKANFACCFDENFQDFKYYLNDIANCSFIITNIVKTKNNNFVVTYRRQK